MLGRVLVTMAAATIGAGSVAAQDVGVPLGTVPEAVTLEDLDGRPVALDRWVGHGPVLLEFWATWCPVCHALEPTLRAAHARFGDRVTFLVIAVGVNQSPRSIRRYLERHPIDHPVLWDGRGRATRAYRAPTTGYVVILDAAGRVAYTGTGEDQDLTAALARVLEQ